MLKARSIFKMKFMEVHLVELKDINLDEKKFCLSPIIEFQSLKASIARVGLLVPPMIKPENGIMILASGWRRVLACRELSLEKIPVFVAPEEMSDLDLFIRVLEENLSSRPLSLAEKAEAIYKLNLFGLSSEKIIADYFSALGLPEKREYFFLLYQLAGQGSDKLKKFLHETEISLEALSLFLSFPSPVQEKLIPWLQAVTYSRRREIIINLHEISVREKMSVESILKLPEVETIVKKEGVSLRSTGEALADWLKRRRFPLLTSWEAEFKNNLKELAWPEAVKISYDPTFENEKLEISFFFKNKSEFLTRLKELIAIAQKPSFQKLFRRTLEE